MAVKVSVGTVANRYRHFGQIDIEDTTHAMLVRLPS